MDNKNKDTKIRKTALKVIILCITTLIILLLYKNLNEENYDVSRESESVFLSNTENNGIIDSEENDIIQNDNEVFNKNEDLNSELAVNTKLEEELEEQVQESQQEESERTTYVNIPDLTGMDEATAKNVSAPKDGVVQEIPPFVIL